MSFLDHKIVVIKRDVSELKSLGFGIGFQVMSSANVSAVDLSKASLSWIYDLSNPESRSAFWANLNNHDLRPSEDLWKKNPHLLSPLRKDTQSLKGYSLSLTFGIPYVLGLSLGNSQLQGNETQTFIPENESAELLLATQIKSRTGRVITELNDQQEMLLAVVLKPGAAETLVDYGIQYLFKAEMARAKAADWAGIARHVRNRTGFQDLFPDSVSLSPNVDMGSLRFQMALTLSRGWLAELSRLISEPPSFETLKAHHKHTLKQYLERHGLLRSNLRWEHHNEIDPRRQWSYDMVPADPLSLCPGHLPEWHRCESVVIANADQTWLELSQLVHEKFSPTEFHHKPQGAVLLDLAQLIFSDPLLLQLLWQLPIEQAGARPMGQMSIETGKYRAVYLNLP